MKIKIAILMASFNRKYTTLRSIKNIYNQNTNSIYKFKIFLTDDNSYDNTANFIKKKYPEVIILKGNGNLYWTGGTNKSWIAAIKDKINFDYYLWLNDDTFLYPNAITDLLSAKKFFSKKDLICAGSTKDKNNKRTYGGLLNSGSKFRVFKNKIIYPNQNYQIINRFNGNIVLISKEAQKKIGFLNENLKHNFSDIEYGIRAEKKKIKMVICPGYQGICEKNKIIINFKDFILGKKIISSGFYFTRKYGGFLWPLHFLSLIYSFLKKHIYFEENSEV